MLIESGYSSPEWLNGVIVMNVIGGGFLRWSVTGGSFLGFPLLMCRSIESSKTRGWDSVLNKQFGPSWFSWHFFRLAHIALPRFVLRCSNMRWNGLTHCGWWHKWERSTEYLSILGYRMYSPCWSLSRSPWLVWSSFTKCDSMYFFPANSIRG